MHPRFVSAKKTWNLPEQNVSFSSNTTFFNFQIPNLAKDGRLSVRAQRVVEFIGNMDNSELILI